MEIPYTWDDPDVYPKKYPFSISCEKVAQDIFTDLYPKIWELVNNKKYFRKSKKHNVLYARESAQHTFCIYLGDDLGNRDFFFEGYIYDMLRKSRLKKYLYRERTLANSHGIARIRLTPYIFILIRGSSPNNGASSFWEHGIHTIAQTLGMRTKRDRGTEVGNLSYFSMPKLKYLEGAGCAIHPVYCNDYLDSFVLGIIATGRREIKFRRFNIRTYRFLKYAGEIRAFMLKASEGPAHRRFLLEYVDLVMDGSRDLMGAEEASSLWRP